MFKMYNTDLITNITEEVTEYKRGNWINMIAPSDDEIKTVCENIKIQEDFIRYALDPEERARIDYEEDDGTTLILADVPIIEKDEDQKDPKVQAFKPVLEGKLPLATCIAKAREALASGVGGRVLHAA